MARRLAADFGAQRARMVERQLRRRGIADERVLDAMARGAARALRPRAAAPPRLRRLGAADRPRQTISQPWIVAAIAEALELDGRRARARDRHRARATRPPCSRRLAREVITVERLEPLAARGARAARRLGIENVEVIVGDGTEGCPSEAPFDGDRRPRDGARRRRRACSRQLAPGGRLVIPIAERRGRHADRLHAHRSELDPRRRGARAAASAPAASCR